MSEVNGRKVEISQVVVLRFHDKIGQTHEIKMTLEQAADLHAWLGALFAGLPKPSDAALAAMAVERGR